ncbi:MAG: hypothetical protein LLG20_18345 [Acidobacteriales bacterium]|nr:hypothetical protein [Terriglobales bacterium]
MTRILDALFGCSHSHTTRPMAPRGWHGHGETVTCLDCGQRFRYDWSRMRRGEAVTASESPERRAEAVEVRA